MTSPTRWMTSRQPSQRPCEGEEEEEVGAGDRGGGRGGPRRTTPWLWRLMTSCWPAGAGRSRGEGRGRTGEGGSSPPPPPPARPWASPPPPSPAPRGSRGREEVTSAVTSVRSGPSACSRRSSAGGRSTSWGAGPWAGPPLWPTRLAGLPAHPG